MNNSYAACMSREIIQVRDVPSEDLQAIRAHATSRNMSLSSYLRELIHADASRLTMDEVLARVAGRASIEADGDQIRAFIDGDRR